MTAVTMSEAVETRTRGDRFVATSLFALAAVFVALQVIAGEITPFWGPPAALYLVLGIALLWRAPRWLVTVAMVLVVTQVGTSLPFMIPGLAHPETPASFLPDILILIGSLAVVAGAVVALRSRTQSRSRRPIGLVAGAAAVAAALVSVVSSAGVASDARQAGDVDVVAQHVAYPQRVEVDRRGALWIDNRDPFRHTFVVEGTELRAELPGATAVRVEADLAPGTYTFFCDVPGHEESMQGALHVE